jgi:hypothetical protein
VSADGRRQARESAAKLRAGTGQMRLRNIGIGAAGAIIIVGSILAAASVWLLLTNPVTIANAINEGEVSPFISSLAQVILQGLLGLLKYL